jgi:hypothetical protein
VSWTIDITYEPVAADTKRAWKQLDALREEEEAREYGTLPSGRMLELYGRLVARYPCITEDPSSPWSDGPLIYDFGDKLTTVGVVTSRIEDALPVIIETATDMGFTVFDPGDEAIHRPKGWQAPVETNREGTSKKPWWMFWA